ncbi:hypothetical protein B0H19DRAFT_1181110, partial [Mycena capillaripes]
MLNSTDSQHSPSLSPLLFFAFLFFSGWSHKRQVQHPFLIPSVFVCYLIFLVGFEDPSTAMDGFDLYGLAHGWLRELQIACLQPHGIPV